MRALGIAGLLALSLIAAGCGDSKAPTAAPAKANAAPTGATAAKEVADPEPDPSPKDQIPGAVRALDKELDTPYFDNAKLKGSVQSDTEVCVTVTVKDPIAGSGKSHFVVTVPDHKIGEPLDGTCKKPKPSADERISPVALDKLANQLLKAIDSGDEANLRAEAKRVKRKLDYPIPMVTEQANLIHSATGAILNGIDTGNASQLKAAKRFLNESLDQ